MHHGLTAFRYDRKAEASLLSQPGTAYRWPGLGSKQHARSELK